MLQKAFWFDEHRERIEASQASFNVRQLRAVARAAAKLAVALRCALDADPYLEVWYQQKRIDDGVVMTHPSLFETMRMCNAMALRFTWVADVVVAERRRLRGSSRG